MSDKLAACRVSLSNEQCSDCHREQLAIEHSMRDLDSAVGRLDNILMSLYVIISAVILAVALVCYTRCPWAALSY